jgi:thiosulfate dehydrogenase
LPSGLEFRACGVHFELERGGVVLRRFTGIIAAALTIGVLGAVGADEGEGDRPLPPGPLGETIKLGEALVRETTTQAMTKPYVGNALNCTSCHLDGGQDPEAGTFLGVATAYPAYSPREGRVITLEDRILNCFMRSCNGVRPPLGSEPSVAIAAYITWLSADQPIAMNPERAGGPGAVKALSIPIDKADAARGRAIFAEKCVDCHRKNGQGDEMTPPVWGDRSFNKGAGLARVDKLGAWLKVAMPEDDPNMTEQEALDVAAFVNSHDRPEFRLRDHLPPAEKLGEYNAKADDSGK